MRNTDKSDVFARQFAPIQVRMERSRFCPETVYVIATELNSGMDSESSREDCDLTTEYAHRVWARELRFPQEGEVYEALVNFDIDYLTSHSAPFTGGGRGVLPKGARIRVGEVPTEQPIGVCCDPLQYDDLHHLIVPQQERECASYVSYCFFVETVDLNKHFRLVFEPSDSKTHSNG